VITTVFLSLCRCEYKPSSHEVLSSTLQHTAHNHKESTLPSPCVSSVVVENFRNIKSAELKTSTINIISGSNGSGKSSFLEALFYLSHFKSFRTSKPQRLIHHDSERFSLFCTATTDSGFVNVGVQRNLSHDQTLKLNYETAKTSTVAHHLPMQFLDTQCHELFTAGPALRRHFLNWGLFHMKQSFHHTWKNFCNILKQRNAILRQRNINVLDSWDHQLTPLCEDIHTMRLDYVTQLTPIVKDLIKTLLNTDYPQVELRYQPGWNTDVCLASLLKDRLFKDLELGYTQLGPHRADLQIIVNNRPAQDYFSQGQMKLAAYALKISQCLLQKSINQKNTIFLIDDLQAELDTRKQSIIIGLLTELDNQCFYTSLNPSQLLESLERKNDITKFHVEHGRFSKAQEIHEEISS